MWKNSTDPLIKDIRGNYIVIKHSENEYSLICHIKSNSFLVKKGDAVKRYQKLAECGNSGNTTEPYIHFHVQNRKGFVLSAGLPIEFKDIKVEKKKIIIGMIQDRLSQILTILCIKANIFIKGKV